VPPVPERPTSWQTFLRAHWGAIAAMDFFHVEVLTLRGPARYAVLFVIDLKTRAVEIAGIVREPSEEWMVQVARNLTDAVDGFLLGKKRLIVDRDPNFTRDFRDMLQSSGVQPVRLPSRSPNLNAFAERFVRSIKQECLERVVPMGEAHLRELVNEYVQHYQHERPHQGLGGELIVRQRVCGTGPIRKTHRLGGLLNHYERQAA
jgi:putative transposase